ncbi:MAG: tryptophan synthase subunit alpha [Solobacterium sp.]|nr:tryptophan synthase subunit alpha [Solobacterium sp.]
MSRIRKAFDKKAFIAFITCGDPDLETTRECILEMVKNGADLIELGIPFSDPTAEGPVIMEADERALKGGVTTQKIMAFAKELRSQTDVPLVFMTYANVVFSYGAERFMKEASEAGVDGLILPDVPFEEKDDFLPYCRQYGVDLVSMIAPTSEDRIAAIAREAEGFLYIVSSLGVTGVRSEITTDIASIVNTVREYTDIPCAVGFGISEPSQAYAMAQVSDGVIVGSAIVRIIAKYGKDAPAHCGAYVRPMKDAIREL